MPHRDVTSAPLAELRRPLIIAPMAGGPTTPQLVAAAHHAGGLGFLASGSINAAQLHELLSAPELIDVPCGVNLFAPQPTPPTPAAIAEVTTIIGTTMDTDAVDYSFDWAAKLDVILTHAQQHDNIRAVSSSFGCFSAAEITTLHAHNLEAWVSVTNTEEACAAVNLGADVLIVQGHEAGGHRLTWDMAAEPNQHNASDLCTDISTALATAQLAIPPLVAAGGVRTPQDTQQLLAQPHVIAVQCGSAFLRAFEAGTSAFNRNLLAQGGTTVSTRAFSGRFARGLETLFTQAHPNLPPSYPLLGSLLKTQRNHPETAYCLVGVGVEHLRTGSASDIINYLIPD